MKNEKDRKEKKNNNIIINNGINILNLMDNVSITADRAKAFNDVEQRTARRNPKWLLVMPTNECTTRLMKTESELTNSSMSAKGNE